MEFESVTIGYVFKCGFYLPENASNFLNPLSDPFDITTQLLTGNNRRRRFLDGPQSTDPPDNEYQGFDNEQNEHFEKHQAEVKVIESGTESTSIDDDEIIDDEVWIEQEVSYNNDPNALKTSPYLGTARFSIYKAIAAVASRFDLF